MRLLFEAPEPVTLRYSHSWQARPDDLAKMTMLSQRFNQETGLLIKHIPTPESTHDYLELCRKLLGAGPSGTDLLSIDLIWSSLLASDLMDLRPHLQRETEKMAPELLDSYTVSGKLTAAPFNVPRGGLEYREDVLRRYGYDHPPQTWEELEGMAQRIQAGERAKGHQDFWGYVWQGAAAEALMCNGLEWQASEGAGRIIEKDRRISINNPKAIRTWERARRWIGWISPPSVLAYRERDSMNVFDSGKAAFHRLWLITPVTRVGQEQHTYWRSLRPVVPRGFTNTPAGSAGSAGTLGGNGLVISRHTPHPQEAMNLMQFLIWAQIEEGEKKRRVAGTTRILSFALTARQSRFSPYATSRKHRHSSRRRSRNQVRTGDACLFHGRTRRSSWGEGSGSSGSRVGNRADPDYWFQHGPTGGFPMIIVYPLSRLLRPITWAFL